MTNTRQALQQLITRLQENGFEGDIEYDYAQRIVAATDNSIYQVTPQAILYPNVEEDINRAMRCVHEQRHDRFTLCARGAATGTNGQSLSKSLILDCSRYLKNIISFDENLKQITLQPGVVLDQVNDFLAEFDLFFPIDISSSSRATIGGMVATDASGKGSLIYGKTSNYIQNLDLVLADGSDYQAEAHQLDDLGIKASAYPDFLLPIALELEQQSAEIDRVFPQMNRGLTGYNLQQTIDQADIFNPCFLLAGSEGTLGISKRITLRVIKKPTHRCLTVIFYRDFLRALEHIDSMLGSSPAAIEMLDDKIIQLAQSDSVWFSIKSLFNETSENSDIKAINYVEHVGYSTEEVAAKHQQLQAILRTNAADYSVILTKTEYEPNKISALWNLRKRAVGLLGKLQHSKRGIAFVEDTAVPPENLSRYIKGFRNILDDANLDYGMYGHADAGVLHVRPLLDLLQQQDRQLIRSISDQVAALALENNGVLWGEHGRGFRGEYTPLFFGEELYPVLRRIKNYFDPYNLLNPGKLVTPDADIPIIALDQVTMRGELDQQITENIRNDYASALACNGNGTCHSWKVSEAMCPSYKATGNKFFSPKGRAAMLREWMRLQESSKPEPEMKPLEDSLALSLQHCLSCKSCTSTCPLNVDIPELKSRFLEQRHEQQPGSLKNLFIKHFESLIALGSRLPALSNLLLRFPLGAKSLQALSGLNRLPLFSPVSLSGITELSPTALGRIKLPDNAVILLRDNYLHSFDGKTIEAACRVLQQIGYRVYVSQPIRNGKLLYVKGFRQLFNRQAQQVIEQTKHLAATGKPLLSIETMTRLMFEQEYPSMLNQADNIQVQSIESFLVANLDRLQQISAKSDQAVTLLPHCMEQTQVQESGQQWKEIFAASNIDCEVIDAGCCGMSGLFGHEQKNNRMSDDIFALQWDQVAKQKKNTTLLASGYSCRCQLKNHHVSAIHPVQYLLQRMV